jgi:hypothetical protein
MLQIAAGAAHLFWIGLMMLLVVATLLGFLWAWRSAQLETPEFSKYKVFNDCGPDEAQPCPLASVEPSDRWRPMLLGSMVAWLTLILAVFCYYL